MIGKKHLPNFASAINAIRKDTSDLDLHVESRRFLVIGGTGFVGTYLVEELLARGAAEVRILCRTPPGDDPTRNEKIHYVTGSVTDAAVVSTACKGIDVIFHTAANYGKPNFGRFGKGEAVYTMNVGGVENVIAASKDNGVSTLVYTSSTNVIFDGQTRLEATEETPYANEKKVDHYSRSKIAAEQKVLSASDEHLQTCVLRPNGIYGPREDFITGKVLGLVKKLRGLPFSINPKQKTDWTFVYNLVFAHFLFVAKAAQGAKEAAGKAYFITDCAPPLHTMREFVGGFLRAMGYRIRHWIPVPKFLMVYGCLFTEWFCHILSPIVRINPPFTKAEALKSVAAHTHSCERAKKLLGYRPLFSTTEGLDHMGEELCERHGVKPNA
jgi:nucleoside-diphosphate-sugar epimerase